MHTETKTQARMWPWLLAGVVLIALAHTRFGIALAGWLAPIPFLRALRLARGVKSRMWFALALSIAWVAAFAKIVTEPLPALFALFGLGTALVQWPGYAAWDWLHRRVGARASVLGFAVVMTLLEWLQHRTTPLASWGAAAYTQVENLPLLQLASVTGMAGVSFVVYLVAAQLELVLSRRLDGVSLRRPLIDLAWAFALVAAIHVGGAARLDAPRDGTRSRVAAIATPATFPIGGVPDAQGRAAIVDELVQRTARAAQQGARVAVHTEAALLAYPDEEPRVLERFARAARDARIHVVVGYILPLRDEPLYYENKLAWFDPEGKLREQYLKHEPAPGEPMVVGTGALRTFDTELGRVGSALCYDYDFPALAHEHGRAGVDFVALPSSDWLGIDPIHTQMARLRAIENGTSIVRSTRFGLSGAIDPHGRFTAAQSSFTARDPVMIASVPRQHVPTLYARTGDWFVAACALVLLSLLVTALMARTCAAVPGCATLESARARALP